MKNLVLLDVNGLLIDKYHKIDVKDDIYDFRTQNNYYIYKRPYLNIFLDFIFTHFLVGIWSSMNKETTEDVLSNILSDEQFKQLLIVYTQEDCDVKGYFENGKPIYLKNLNKIWNKKKFEKYKLNTLLIDDSPYKSVLNPEYTSIHLRSFKYTHKYDSELIDLKNFLQKSLGKSLNIKSFLNNYSYNKYSIFSDTINFIDVKNKYDNGNTNQRTDNKKINSVKKHLPILFFIFGIYKAITKR